MHFEAIFMNNLDDGEKLKYAYNYLQKMNQSLRYISIPKVSKEISESVGLKPQGITKLCLDEKWNANTHTKSILKYLEHNESLNLRKLSFEIAEALDISCERFFLYCLLMNEKKETLAIPPIPSRKAFGEISMEGIMDSSFDEDKCRYT